MTMQSRVVLVSGASRGIGAAIALAFAREGASVVVNFLRQRDAAEAVAAQCREAGGDAVALQADVTDPAQVRDLIARGVDAFGRLDALVHNAFAPTSFDPEQRRGFAELGWDDCRRQLDGALGAAWHLAQAALPHLRARADGAIVHLVTDLVDDPVVPYVDYASAKSALVGFTRQLAADLGPQGVRVNAVAPGLVHPTAGSAATRAAFREAIAAATPLRRLARPEDIAGPVVFLASPAAAFVTGQVLVVDGGRVMR